MSIPPIPTSPVEPLSPVVQVSDLPSSSKTPKDQLESQSSSESWLEWIFRKFQHVLDFIISLFCKEKVKDLPHLPSLEEDLLSNIGRGEEERVDQLLKEPLNINFQNKKGITPLMMAITYTPALALKILDLAGCDVNVQDNNGETALMKIAAKGLSELRYQQEVVNTDNEKEITKQVIKLILKSAKVELQDKSGKTALHWAVLGKNEAAINALCDAQIDLEVKDKKGETALMIAFAQGSIDIVSLLRQRGASLEPIKNAPDEFFNWPGMFQTSTGQTLQSLAEVQQLNEISDILQDNTKYRK